MNQGGGRRRSEWPRRWPSATAPGHRLSRARGAEAGEDGGAAGRARGGPAEAMWRAPTRCDGPASVFSEPNRPSARSGLWARPGWARPSWRARFGRVTIRRRAGPVIRIDMSEYIGKKTPVARLIGAPQANVGYDRGRPITEGRAQAAVLGPPLRRDREGPPPTIFKRASAASSTTAVSPTARAARWTS